MRSPVVTLSLPAPAAGSDLAVTLSTSDRVKLLSVVGKLTTSADGLTRAPVLQVENQDGTLVLTTGDGAIAQASAVILFNWAPNIGTSATTGEGPSYAASMSTPCEWLEPGDKLQTLTSGLEAADQWSDIVIRYVTSEDWLRMRREVLFGEVLKQLTSVQSA